jgi:exodeoxyribonuclease VII large subunit
VNPATHTLSEIQQRIKQTLDAAFTEPCWITAEINGLHTNPAGHCYLELVEKDAASQALKAKAAATIWAYSYRMLKPYFETATGQSLCAGIRVLIKASVQYHPLYGLNLSITDIDPAYTVGELEIQRRKTIARLQSDGVFDMNRTIRLPLLPQRIAVISSEQAAGYQDFMKQLHRNEYGYAFRTQLFPSLVQGAEAVGSIIDSLSRINAQRTAFDAVVIIRGGGSATDLACFDDYELASHVAQFPLPVLTGIGHEKDQSIVDLVAHTSLKTPTAVATFLIDCLAERENRLDTCERALRAQVQHVLQSAKDRLTQYAYRQQTATKIFFQKAGFRLQMIEKEIQHKDPATVLARGYAVVSLNGTTVRTAAALQENDEVQITLYKGNTKARIMNNE